MSLRRRLVALAATWACMGSAGCATHVRVPPIDVGDRHVILIVPPAATEPMGPEAATVPATVPAPFAAGWNRGLALLGAGWVYRQKHGRWPTGIAEVRALAASEHMKVDFSDVESVHYEPGQSESSVKVDFSWREPSGRLQEGTVSSALPVPGTRSTSRPR